jgi:hypothetical protein
MSGYATVPKEVQEASAQWVAAAYWQTKDNPANYPGLLPAGVRFLLARYRRHPIG